MQTRVFLVGLRLIYNKAFSVAFWPRASIMHVRLTEIKSGILNNENIIRFLLNLDCSFAKLNFPFLLAHVFFSQGALKV